MDTGFLLAAVSSLLGAGGMYVILEYKNHDDRQVAHTKLSKLQAEGSNAKRELQAYVKYVDYVAGAKQVVVDQAKTLTAKVTREYVHVEHIPKDPIKLKPPGLVIVKYAVEFTLGVDLKADGFDISARPSGLDIKIGRPSLIGTPSVKEISHEFPIEGVVADEKHTLDEIKKAMPAGLALKFAGALASDASAQALIERNIIECVLSHLAKQPGVVHLPSITISAK
ncbi:hypothetical protein [Rhodoferax aquaticus]|uniref:DUF4230 domain-containing protein n=1 Tax=Rhodoferax aquaticus TaxID=2527691 RepID=A0A515EPP9_9BURK|nr:hypothetical protein [Rhodoferax aquaticus]QDL54642.1 hypothetical protein EXZ61_10955 [Rhodoferax aquaticus]